LEFIRKHLLATGLGLMLLSAFIFSLYDVLAKHLTVYFPVTEIALFRFALGGLILWPILSLRGVRLRGNQTWILILRGLCGTLSFFCLLKSLTLIPLSTTMVLFYTFPVFVVLFSTLLFRTRIEMGEVLLIGLGLLGAYILIDPNFHSLNPGYLFALLASAIGGMATVMVHKARERNGPLIIYFYFCLMGTLLSLPCIQEFRVPNANQAIVLILASIVVMVAQILMNQGFRYCRAAEGSLILMSEIIFAAIGGFLVFKDPMTPRFLLGALLIIGSGLGLNLINRRSRHAPVSEPGDS